MMNLPNPNEIEYFLEVAQTQNMSRAAERLGIRQPTLSVALAKLEHGLGVQLLTRTKKGVFLTESGRVFLTKAQDLLHNWNLLKQQTQSQGNELKGHVRLGCHVSVALYTLPNLMPEILKEFPQLEFSLEHDFSRKITEGVISLNLDLGVVVNPVQHPDLVIKRLCRDEVAYWKSEKIHPINEKVLISDHNMNQAQVILKKAKINFDRFMTSSSLEVVRSLAVQGAGVAILPGRVVQSQPKHGLKKITSLPTYQDEVCLIYRSERRQSRTIQVLSEKITQVFRET
jgi:LysR family transcriptional regulator, cell division regulator